MLNPLRDEPTRALVFLCLCSMVFSAATGCAKDDRVSEVEGVVTLDGEPVADASVTFMPKDGGRPAFGVTDDDGKYALTTFSDGDGAVVGNHLVSITAVDEEVGEKAEALAEEYGSLAEVVQPRSMKPKQIWRVPERYSEQDSSGLAYEVRRGETNQANFDLTTKP